MKISYCPECNTEGVYIGMNEIECRNPDCRHYKDQQTELWHSSVWMEGKNCTYQLHKIGEKDFAISVVYIPRTKEQ